MTRVALRMLTALAAAWAIGTSHLEWFGVNEPPLELGLFGLGSFVVLVVTLGTLWIRNDTAREAQCAAHDE